MQIIICLDSLVAEVLAVVRVRPQAYGAVGECALAPADVLLRKHDAVIYIYFWMIHFS